MYATDMGIAIIFTRQFAGPNAGRLCEAKVRTLSPVKLVSLKAELIYLANLRGKCRVPTNKVIQVPIAPLNYVDVYTNAI